MKPFYYLWLEDLLVGKTPSLIFYTISFSIITTPSPIELRGFAPIGIMELWSNGMMGLKEFFTIRMVCFRLYPQYFSILSEA
jgi:hypothetical protein